MSVETAGTLAAILFLLIAIVQAALALGSPIGGIAWGSRYKGVLPQHLRIGSGIAVLVLGFAALVVLPRAGVLTWSPLPRGALAPACWALAAFLALNTLGNIASKSRVERFVFGPTTAILVLLCAIVAVNGPGPG